MLDLGAPLGANVAFFGQYRCRLHITDTIRTLAERPAPPAEGNAPPAEGNAPPADYAALFPFATGTRFDVVLAWDVFSYLPPTEVSALIRHVGTFCAPGTLLHALVFTGERLPPEPAAVRVDAARELDYAPAGPGVLHNPRPTPIAFERMVPGFRMLHSFLLRGGLQDYLLTFE